LSGVRFEDEFSVAIEGFDDEAYEDCGDDGDGAEEDDSAPC